MTAKTTLRIAFAAATLAMVGSAANATFLFGPRTGPGYQEFQWAKPEMTFEPKTYVMPPKVRKPVRHTLRPKPYVSYGKGYNEGHTVYEKGQ